MFILGLTGSLAMGKTTAAGMFAELNVPVFYSDDVIHEILKTSLRAKKSIRDIFPGVFENGEVSRPKLGKIVFSNPVKLRQLEGILHPPYMAKLSSFIVAHRKKKARIIVLDVPLLFETGVDTICDAVAVVTAKPQIQKKRALGRAGMTRERLDIILARQTPNQEKRERADYVIFTDGPKEETRKKITAIMNDIKTRIK